MKHFLLSFYLVLMATLCFSQPKLSDFNNLESKLAKDSRKTLVFVHTDWCKYCQLMLNTSFRSEAVVTELNKYFYYLPFNGESNESIQFGNRSFSPGGTQSNPGQHELTSEIASIEGEVKYPSIIVLNEKLEIIYRKAGYHSEEAILKLLKTSK